VDIGNLAGKAGELLGQHGEKVEAAVDKAGELAKDRFGHEEQVDAGVEKLKGLLPDGTTDREDQPEGRP